VFGKRASRSVPWPFGMTVLMPYGGVTISGSGKAVRFPYAMMLRGSRSMKKSLALS
jgi:hypothetical protein